MTPAWLTGRTAGDLRVILAAAEGYAAVFAEVARTSRDARFAATYREAAEVERQKAAEVRARLAQLNGDAP